MLIDEYSSLIWTERYNDYGDFELCIPIDGSEKVSKLMETDDNGKSVWLNGYAEIDISKNKMFLEQFAIDYDPETGYQLIITGRSLETILMRRIVWGLKVVNGKLQEALKTIITESIISPQNSKRRISKFRFLDNTDLSISSLELNMQFTGDNLYDIVSAVCKEKEIGFKINIDNDSDRRFVFELYSGRDRTSTQNLNDPVIFSPDNENLLNSKYVETNGFLKNCALIAGEGEGAERTYSEIDSDETGLNRRELFVDARDLSSVCGGFVLLTQKPDYWEEDWPYYYENNGTQDNPIYEPISSSGVPEFVSVMYYYYDDSIMMTSEEYNNILLQRGQEKLKENDFVKAFDGEVDVFTTYQYGVDFFLGDIVEIEDGLGHESRTRINEIIISIDQNGCYMYPTFILMEDGDEE